MRRITTIALFALSSLALARPAEAQDHRLYYAQAGAMLNYAEAEVRVLYNAVTDRVFDSTVTMQATEELKRVLAQAKRQVDRAATLLPEGMAANEKAMLGLRDRIVVAERQLGQLEGVLQAMISQIESESEDEDDEEDDEAEAEEDPGVDWATIRNHCTWVAGDIRAARSSYAAVAKRVVKKTLKRPPNPRGERPE